MEAIVMFTPPRIQCENGEWEIQTGRIDKAISLAITRKCPLIIAGDGTKTQEDLDFFETRARNADVKIVIRAWNNNERHTRGDARAIIQAVNWDVRLNDIHHLVLVTCWYHQIRAWSALRAEIRDLQGSFDYKISFSPVWANYLDGLSRLLNLRRGELRGAWDYWRDNAQQTRGWRHGKDAI